ncbi:hypothetical protein BGZ97_000014 [Linnemannia gamsii]|uniref:NAD-dependent epimerase/dehydratase domain-containing protein n=1 Tax=Linnemannia gamsii TaxID=64522 RepID=A0A9P6RQ45_9FUNG|nr:hypothetical protein BGZ97_000014 [Linnemannia gamsii]
MHFFEGDITINKEWVEYHIRKCDVILPLVAIATPATYVKQPLRVFELDFEANLPIVRSAVKYVDGGLQKRAFTDIDDGIDALVRMIDNPADVALGKIYNIGNPKNNFSVRELAQMMLKLAAEFPEYASNAEQVKLIETSSGAYYGEGYQDIQNRVPSIDNTSAELNWQPTIGMDEALRKIFKAYRNHAAEARALAAA